MKRPRPSIPNRVKFEVWSRQKGLCRDCRGPHENPRIGYVEFDHRPPLSIRTYTVEDGYTPPANDPDYIDMLCAPCHSRRTFGPGGERRITTRGGDIGELAHTKRINKKHREHLERMRQEVAEVFGLPPYLLREDNPKRKWWRWPARKLRSRGFATKRRNP